MSELSELGEELVLENSSTTGGFATGAAAADEVAPALTAELADELEAELPDELESEPEAALAEVEAAAPIFFSEPFLLLFLSSFKLRIRNVLLLLLTIRRG